MDTYKYKLIKLQEILDAQKNGARILLWDDYDNSFTDVSWDLKTLPLNTLLDYVSSGSIHVSFEKEEPNSDWSKSPFESLESTINTSSRDFSKNKDLVWIYGIVSGWDNDSLKEFEKNIGGGHLKNPKELKHCIRITWQQKRTIQNKQKPLVIERL